MSVTPVTGFRIPEDELELLDEAAVCRSELVRFLIVSGLDRPGGDLGLVADVLEDLAGNFSGSDRELLFRTVRLLRGTAQRHDSQVVLEGEFSKGEGVGL